MRVTKEMQEKTAADATAARNPMPHMATGIVATYDQLMAEACIEYDAWEASVREGKAKPRGWSRDESSLAVPVSETELKRFGIGV